MLTGP
jgi:hypothetical protein